MPFSSDVLTLEQSNHIATLWLDRPDGRNAMGPDLWTDLPHAMQILAEDDTVRAIVIAAKGKVFTAGLDLKAMGSMLMGGGDGSPVQQRRQIAAEVQKMQHAITSVADCPKPVIAAIHGYCIGAGVDLITACDVRLAAADVSFSVRETKMAIVADLGTLQRLPRIVLPGHVAELVYTGKDIDAARAERIGLVNAVYADADALLEAAYAMAEEIAANSPLAVQGAKAVLHANDGKTIAEGLEYVALWNTAYLQSNDLGEAIMAFMQKRQPSFKGE